MRPLPAFLGALLLMMVLWSAHLSEAARLAAIRFEPGTPGLVRVEGEVQIIRTSTMGGHMLTVASDGGTPQWISLPPDLGVLPFTPEVGMRVAADCVQTRRDRSFLEPVSRHHLRLVENRFRVDTVAQATASPGRAVWVCGTARDVRETGRKRPVLRFTVEDESGAMQAVMRTYQAPDRALLASGEPVLLRGAVRGIRRAYLSVRAMRAAQAGMAP